MSPFRFIGSLRGLLLDLLIRQILYPLSDWPTRLHNLCTTTNGLSHRPSPPCTWSEEECIHSRIGSPTLSPVRDYCYLRKSANASIKAPQLSVTAYLRIHFIQASPPRRYGGLSKSVPIELRSDNQDAPVAPIAPVAPVALVAPFILLVTLIGILPSPFSFSFLPFSFVFPFYYFSIRIRRPYSIWGWGQRTGQAQHYLVILLSLGSLTLWTVLHSNEGKRKNCHPYRTMLTIFT